MAPRAAHRPPRSELSPIADFKWWGWGSASHRTAVAEAAASALRSELGIEPGDGSEPVSLESVTLPPARALPEAVVRAAGGEEAVLSGDEDRIRRAAGRSYPDLVRLRRGELELAPDAVVCPSGRETVAALLTACTESRVAVVPFGGGSSVVGGLDALDGGNA
ncbi:MAG: FAD-binding protein, partial [Actinomycetota bacterium]|nr:FAD-binding protein [Actinomycetota bacterium]